MAEIYGGAARTLRSFSAGRRRLLDDPVTAAGVARQAARPDAALEGERKQVTILFADIKDSLELLADRDPEEASRLLHQALAAMMAAVHRYGGTVNHTLGDGIMALFGAPIAHEDHAVRACYAALEMQDRIELDVRAAGTNVRTRIGINSGEVVVRSISSDLFVDYSAVGRSTHLAGRMEQMASPGTILVTGSTFHLAEGHIEVEALGPTAVRGLAEPIEIYRLVGTGPRRTRFHVAAARGLTPFVGRHAEMAALERVLELAEGGRGQIAAVTGEPGVGKSRLVWEFLRSPRTEGWLVLRATAVPYGAGFAYLPVIALLEDYFGVARHDDEGTVRDKVVRSLGDDASPRVVDPILALLDAAGEDAAWARVDPDQRRQQTVEALCHLLVSRTRAQPVCLVVEDLHWVDQETQDLLDSVIARLPASALLLLTTYRPEYQHAWRNRSFYTELRIEPLPHHEARALLGAILGASPDLAPLQTQLVERTDGNPFFLEESVRHLADTGLIAGQRGAYRLVSDPRGAKTPDTVQAVLQARIDRLPPEDKHLLQAAATVGRVVPRALLEAIVDVPAHVFERSLARLQQAEFLHERSTGHEASYEFGHALMAEVACASLLRDRRRALDARRASGPSCGAG